MAKIRVLITDDAVVIRRLLTDCLTADAEIEVAGTAANGQIALAKIEQVNPDVIILDMEMPVMDGRQTLTALRKTHPKMPVIMFSALTGHGAAATLDALTLGASDYVTKPANLGSLSAAMQRVREEMIPKIKSLCRPAGAASAVVSNRVAMTTRGVLETKPSSPGRLEILAIGTSTGGPNALATLLPALSRNFAVPIVIVQHMPPLFTQLLANRLSTISGLTAQEGQTGAVLKPGEVWLAPGGFHLEVERTWDGLRLRTHDGPLENSCRPSVDVLFRSVAQVCGARSLAVVLTGMGQDGLRGSRSIREAGGRVLAQDEASSVVWGMPGAVSQAGLCDKVLPLRDLAAEINWRVRAGAMPAAAFAAGVKVS